LLHGFSPWTTCSFTKSKAEYHGGKSLWWSQVDHLIAARKQRGQEGIRDKIPFKGMPLVTYLLQSGPTSHRLPTIQSN
jgi:hypothetical protein